MEREMNKNNNGFQQIIFIVPRAYSNTGGPGERTLGPGALDSVPPTDI
jgi:hypothetical protein